MNYTRKHFNEEFLERLERKREPRRLYIEWVREEKLHQPILEWWGQMRKSLPADNQEKSELKHRNRPTMTFDEALVFRKQCRQGVPTSGTRVKEEEELNQNQNNVGLAIEHVGAEANLDISVERRSSAAQTMDNSEYSDAKTIYDTSKGNKGQKKSKSFKRRRSSFLTLLFG